MSSFVAPPEGWTLHSGAKVLLWDVIDWPHFVDECMVLMENYNKFKNSTIMNDAFVALGARLPRYKFTIWGSYIKNSPYYDTPTYPDVEMFWLNNGPTGVIGLYFGPGTRLNLITQTYTELYDNVKPYVTGVTNTTITNYINPLRGLVENLRNIPDPVWWPPLTPNKIESLKKLYIYVKSFCHNIDETFPMYKELRGEKKKLEPVDIQSIVGVIEKLFSPKELKYLRLN